MNKRQRLEHELQGAGLTGAEAKISWLASELDALQAERVAELLRAARRAGREDERKARAAHSRRGQPRDVDDLARDMSRQVRNGLGRRACTELEALTLLLTHFGAGPALIAQAVFALRKERTPGGKSRYSDTKIGMALGYHADFARQEVRRRYGPRPGPEDTRPTLLAPTV